MNTNIDTHKPKEKCGVVGVWTASNSASQFAKQSLLALQHRGHESAGISVFNSKKEIITHKDMGMIAHVLTDDVIKNLGKSKLAIAQTRYGTAGTSSLDNAQPIVVKNHKHQISLGHNGNVPDIPPTLQKLSGGNKELSDTQLMPTLLVKERPNFKTWEDTIAHVLPQFLGAYCLTILTNEGSLYGVRDPYGIRPLCLGRLDDGWIIASESAALDAVGADFVRDIKPGEIIKINSKGELSSSFFGLPKRPRFCIFEYIYFSRPDSFINGKRVREGREESGRLLGIRIRDKKIKPDVVIPVFNSGYPAAKGVAKELNLPIIDAITTSHYIGRTFIHPGQKNRVAAVSGKHNIVPDEITGKSVVVVDDSAIRLTTSSAFVKGLKKAGAAKIYMAFASPPVVNQCDMGIDMRSKKELPAARFKGQSFENIEKNIADYIYVDSVVYLPIEETAKAMGGDKSDFYYYPFGGPHPIRDKQHVFSEKKRKINNKPKICVFISGSGTNLQKIINHVEKKDIDAEIVSVVSNKKDVYGLLRAKKHNIPTNVFEFTGSLSDKNARAKYEEELITYIKKIMPDIIQLSGWMFVLSNNFLKEMQKLEIPVINQHPALLTKDISDTVHTSRGKIPVIRGAHAIKDAFEQDLPVSGITFHQVLPGETFDIGPIILKAEVKRNHDDKFEDFQKRLSETEHLFLPTAIKRVIHVMKNGVDISKGDYTW